MQNGPDANTQLPGTFDPLEQFATTRPDPATEQKLVLPYRAEEPVRDGDADPVIAMLYQGDAQRIEQDARQRTERPANADGSGRPHFLRNVDGEETCGQDGKPWPCDDYLSMLDATLPVGTTIPAGSPDTLDREAAAAALGLTAAEVDAVIAQRTPDTFGSALTPQERT